MPQTVDERIRNYTYGVDAERIKADILAKKTDMVAMQTVATNEMYIIENKVKAILGEAAVFTVDYPKYHCFSKEVYKAQKRFGGGTGLIDEVALLVYKWKARGCIDATLAKIRDDVFAIPAPTVP